MLVLLGQLVKLDIVAQLNDGPISNVYVAGLQPHLYPFMILM